MRKTVSPRPLTGKREDLIIINLTSRTAQSLKFWKSVPSPGWTLVIIVVFLWRRSAEDWEQAAWSEDPLGHTRENSSPCICSALGRCGTASLGTKVSIELPSSLAK